MDEDLKAGTYSVPIPINEPDLKWPVPKRPSMTPERAAEIIARLYDDERA